MTKPKILITGSTGTVGSEVVRQLANENVDVVAMIRNHAHEGKLKRSGVRCVIGDYENTLSLDSALTGIERVFLLSPLDPRQAEHQGRLVDSARRAGVKRIVKLSGIWAAFDSKIDVLKQHAQTEKQIEGSGLEWTHIGPTFFMQNFLLSAPTIQAQGTVFSAYGDGPVNFIDARDVAAFAVRTLVDEGHNQKNYKITGPENRSMADFSRRIGEEIGRSVTYFDLSVDDLFQGMLGAGVSKFSAETVTSLIKTIREGHQDSITPTLEAVIKRKPRFIQDFARNYKAVLLGRAES